ncbi:MAG: YggS family pyridoxal phosphate-dependent enzyme [Candidatus Omnitrophica bacterium]|jgi:pyridoxal phosphate enzyme (YggS family)|nr:YggS family pyridoxal phosphate-dependent enzyme [Candidatus Omnitrophota bacterium]
MIEQRVKEILKGLPAKVELLAATKGREIEEIKSAINGGIRLIGENYVQEASRKFSSIGHQVKWHLIGHLQTNKVKHAVEIFDLIETLDSLELASALDKECKKIGKIMPVLIEVNSAKEGQKYGVLPEKVESFLEKILEFKSLKPRGLMTMGPWQEDPENLRPYFRKLRELFEEIKNNYGSFLDWEYISMGMSSSYKIAIEEGANIVRLGTIIFGERKHK